MKRGFRGRWSVLTEREAVRVLSGHRETTIAATALAFVPNNEIYLLSIVRGQTFEVKETWNPNHVEIETNIRMLARLKQH